MWVLVIINMLPFYSVSDIAALVAQLLPDIPAIQSWRWMWLPTE